MLSTSMKAIFKTLLAVSALVGLGILVFSVLPANPDGSTIRIEIKKGERPLSVAKHLEEAGVTRSGWMLYWVGRMTRSWAKLKAGEYEVSGSQTPLGVLAKLASGVPIQYPITFQEGFNRYEMSSLIQEKEMGSRSVVKALTEDKGFISTLGLGDEPPSTLEGYLFPNTYYFPKGATEEEILRRAVKNFLMNFDEKRADRAKEMGFTRHQVVTLASVVEKETGADVERPLIASVFLNRLKIKMRLQSDPTTIYGIWERFDGNLRKADLFEKTPWNTYQIPALPIGPISNPGLAAIDAVLYPAESNYLYFVSRNNGTHVFSATYDEHLAAVRKFQLDAKAREGKSWRDLNKK